MRSGRFRSGGASAKWRSTAWKPARRSAKPSGPIATIVESPIAESIEYRPPTQSQKPKALSGSIPKAETASRFVDTATTCFATADSSTPGPSRSHFLKLAAFVIVSTVVKVFEQTIASVVSGSRSRTASRRSAPSTFETKRKVRSRSLYGRSAE